MDLDLDLDLGVNLELDENTVGVHICLIKTLKEVYVFCIFVFKSSHLA